jgi:anti-anti-sigma factor
MIATAPVETAAHNELLLTVDIARRSGCAEVIASGEIDASVIGAFEEALREGIACREPVLSVDLTGVTYMDSGCVYALLGAWRALGRRPGAMRLRLGNSPAAAVIRTLGLERLMTIE